MNDTLLCEVVNGEIVIRLKVDALASATVNSLPELLGIDADRMNAVRVTNPQVWAESVRDALVAEEENGETRITKMFESAILHACEWGEEGIEIDD